jgi:hypothetical protein
MLTKYYSYSILFILINYGCDDIEIYDFEVLRNNELNLNSEKITSNDIILNYLSLNSFELNLNVEINYNIDTSKLKAIGVVYGNYEDPILSDNDVSTNSINRNTNFRISELSPNTEYFIRGFIITKNQIMYSSENLYVVTPSNNLIVGNELDCSSLNNVSSLNYPYGSNNSSTWFISETLCQEPPCWTTGQSHGGYVSFNVYNERTGFIELWVNSYDPGYNNIIPTIKINETKMNNIEIIGGNQSSFYFTKIRVNNVYAGNLKVDIEFEENNTKIKRYSIDEIKFYYN